MRSKIVGGAAALLVSIVCEAGAQLLPPPIYLSDPTLANTLTTDNQRRASVAVGADGSYLVVWNSDAAQAGFYDIKGQLFSHEGVKIGSEFQVDQAGANRLQYTPSVAADGVGNYIVAWADFNSTVTDSEIWVRRFDGAANPLADAVQVNTYTTAPQRLPRVAADPAGQFVVVWESVGQDGSGLGIVARRYDGTGAPYGAEFVVNSYTTGDQDRASVDMDGQGFTVVFNDGNTGVAAVEFGTFATDGVPQFQVFGPNHRFADVARLDGMANTFFVAENTSTTGIDGIRTENGVAQSPFPIAADGFNPRLSRPLELGNTLAAPLSPGGDPGPAIDAAVAFADALFTYCIEYSVDPQGILDEATELFAFLDSAPIPDIATGPDGQHAVASQNNSTQGSDVYHGRGGAPRPTPIDPPNFSLSPGTGSGPFSPGVTNTGTTGLGYSGTLQIVPTIRLSPSTVTIDDATANYGTVPAGGNQNCSATGDCYAITVSGTRPGVHWDEAVLETLNTGVHKIWTLHVGQSFADVPDTNLFYLFVENLLHNGITAGGACGGYCPTDGVKRQQMAVFLIKSRFGATVVPPPATGTIFTDVPITNPFAAWIELLYLLGITGGCSGGPPPAPIQFCPDAIVNRQQMAVFLLKTKEGSAYDPPDCTQIFDDVPCTPGAGFSDWIVELYNRQITGGCVPNPPQYCPTNPTNRQQMAAFLVKNFELLLYGP